MFSGDQVPRYHHADGVQHVGPGTYAKGETGQTTGIQQGTYQHDICNPVSIEKMGSHVSADISPIGNPSTFGALPGASGAQLTGIFKHPPHPNQHDIHRIKVSIDCSI